MLLQIEELKAALSSREYQIISECALSNISETPHVVPPLKHDSRTSSVGAIEPIIPQNTAGVESETTNGEAWIMMKVSVVIDLVELRLHPGSTRDAYLATVQVFFFSFFPRLILSTSKQNGYCFDLLEFLNVNSF